MFNRSSTRLLFTLVSLVLFSATQKIESHGFAPDTLITMKNGKELMPLYRLANLIVMSTWKRVTAYDAMKQKWAKRWVEGVGFSQTDSYCRLFFLRDSSPIVCSSVQPFYRISDKKWVKVYKLRSGDKLLCRDSKTVTVSKVVLVQEPLRVCTLQVESSHTFLVGKQGVVTHNIPLALGAFIRFSVPFGAAGAGAGVSFGPVGITVGVLLCGAVGIIYDLHRKKAYATYHSAEGQKTVALFAEEVTKNHGETAVSGGRTQRLPAAASKAHVPAVDENLVACEKTTADTSSASFVPATAQPFDRQHEQPNNDFGHTITDRSDDFTQRCFSDVQLMQDVHYSCVLSNASEVPDEIVNIVDSLHRSGDIDLSGHSSKHSSKNSSGGSMFATTGNHFVYDLDQQEQLIIDASERCDGFQKSEGEAALYDYACKNSDQLGLRKELVEQIKNNGAVYECRSYEIATPVGDLLQDYNYDVLAYDHCYGDQLQQLAHQDCIDILEKIVYQNHAPSLRVRQQDFSKGLVGCVDAAREYNHVGLPEQSFHIIDFCYAFLDCGVDVVKGVLEGTAKGIIGAVSHCIGHPIETAACIVAGKYVFAYHLLCLLENVAEVGADALHAYHAGQTEWDEFLKPVKEQIKELSKQKVSVRGAVEGTTAFVVHWVAQNKLHGGLNDIFKAAKTAVKTKAASLANKISSATPDHVLTTPEGVSFSASSIDNNQLSANNNTLAKQAHAPKQQNHASKQQHGKRQSGNNRNQSNCDKNQQAAHQQETNSRQQHKREIGAPRYPNKWYREMAETMGYRLDKNPPFNTYRQLAFKKGNQWISPDVTGHKGGVWKVFDRKFGRWATYNEDLTIEIGT
ncbi:MAG TPA: polymorphic toxin-type HINT domain-containing protein [Candidatus Babeliales bacterium]|nr:polymorphic toxin-type HINT domain-containing protein [Candidatus Babeliales bacterium]